MKIFILGGNGYLGPWTVKAMRDRHDILLTDINEPPADYKGEYQKLSVDDIDGVVKAAEGMDVIVNLSVLRPHRKLAFDVNTMGNYAMMVAAREHRIKRVITTGPHSQMAGPHYEWDYDLNPDMPAAPGTGLYTHTKGLGQEICRVFSERHGIQVITMLYYNMRHSWDLSGPLESEPVHHEDMAPYTTEWEDCGTAIRAAVEVPEERLASKCESFFVLADIPHRKFTNEKTKRVLGWEPRYHIEPMWNKKFRKPRDTSHGAF
jgi:nucleoside-diphosphate-sugar epimerase